MRHLYTPLFALYVFAGCTSLLAEENRGELRDTAQTGAEIASREESYTASDMEQERINEAERDEEYFGWPREYNGQEGEVVVYQPQVDEWVDYTTLTAKAAVSVQFTGSDAFHYGALFFRASTEVDKEEDEVLLDDIEITKLHFSDIEDSLAAQASDVVRTVLSDDAGMIMSLDRLVADLESDSQDIRDVDLNLDPPPIFYSDQPAILLTFLGEPSFKPVSGVDDLMFAVNTNWDLLLDFSSSTYYLLNDESWMEAADPLSGPWKNTEKLPRSFSNLPDDDEWRDVKKQIPGKIADEQMLVFVSTEPSELIETDGEPEFGLVSGTRLMYVSNTDSDLFFDPEERNFYFLTAGRWFSAENLQGPWSAASADLPEEFQKIPEDHEKSEVLSAIPGTPDAEAAVLLASVPQKATVSRKNTTTEIIYEGEPEFVEIKGASQGVYYGVNSPNDVFRVSGLYYALVDGVWFVASTPTGPWAVAVNVDEAIYTIPKESPKYNATYVRVYDSTPEKVVVGYTSGYSGSYVAATGVLMFGLGLLAGNSWGDHRYRHYHYRPHYYGYGSGMRYRYGRGYYRGARPALYGPYGGISGIASYNPVTRHYSRGGYARALDGRAFAHSSYSPYSNDRVAHSAITTPYGSWGKTVISKGGNWEKARRRARRDGRRISGDGHKRDRDRVFRVSRGKHNNIFVGENGSIYRHDDKFISRHETKGGWKRSQAKLDKREKKMLKNRESNVKKKRKKRKAADKARKDREKRKAADKVRKDRKTKRAADKARKDRKAKQDAGKARKDRKAKQDAGKARKDRKVKQDAGKARKDRKAKQDAGKARKDRKVKQDAGKARKDRKTKQDAGKARKDRKAKQDAGKARKDRKTKQDAGKARKDRKTKQDAGKARKDRRAKQAARKTQKERKGKSTAKKSQKSRGSTHAAKTPEKRRARKKTEDRKASSTANRQSMRSPTKAKPATRKQTNGSASRKRQAKQKQTDQSRSRKQPAKQKQPGKKCGENDKECKKRRTSR